MLLVELYVRAVQGGRQVSRRGVPGTSNRVLVFCTRFRATLVQRHNVQNRNNPAVSHLPQAVARLVWQGGHNRAVSRIGSVQEEGESAAQVGPVRRVQWQQGRPNEVEVGCASPSSRSKEGGGRRVRHFTHKAVVGVGGRDGCLRHFHVVQRLCLAARQRRRWLYLLLLHQVGGRAHVCACLRNGRGGLSGCGLSRLAQFLHGEHRLRPGAFYGRVVRAGRHRTHAQHKVGVTPPTRATCRAWRPAPPKRRSSPSGLSRSPSAAR